MKVIYVLIPIQSLFFGRSLTYGPTHRRPICRSPFRVQCTLVGMSLRSTALQFSIFEFLSAFPLFPSFPSLHTKQSEPNSREPFLVGTRNRLRAGGPSQPGSGGDPVAPSFFLARRWWITSAPRLRCSTEIYKVFGKSHVRVFARF